MPYHSLILQQVRHMVDDPLIIAFVWCVFADIVTGYARSICVCKTSSTKGMFGLIKHTIVLVSVISVYPYLTSLGFEWAAKGLIYGFIINYLTSIAENWGQMGLWLPPQVKRFLIKAQSGYNTSDHDKISTKQNKGGK